MRDVGRREKVRFSGKGRDQTSEAPPHFLGVLYHRDKFPAHHQYTPSHNDKMAARLTVARAARQLSFAAAKRPMCSQRWQVQQKERLFSVSSARMFGLSWALVIESKLI